MLVKSRGPRETLTEGQSLTEFSHTYIHFSDADDGD